VAFKAEELTAKIFPMLAGGCLQDTVTKGRPCPQNTNVPCADKSRPPCGANTNVCLQDTASPTTHPDDPPGPRKRSAAGLALLRAQLQDRLAQGPGASL
jgi:hypothetical protein